MKLGANRIREIVQSLQNFSRIDESEIKSVDIHDGLDSALLILSNRLKPKADKPAIKLIKEYGSLPLIECYPVQINQVFMNVLANAIDAIEEAMGKDNLSPKLGQESGGVKSGRIRIKTEFDSARQMGVIRIADNGMGMEQAMQPEIFEPFFTTKPVGKGAGIGLAIGKEIVVEKHGGKLTCISAPGDGAEFIVEIPLSQVMNKVQR